jgi:phage-related protein
VAGLKFGSLFKDVGAGFQDSLAKMGKKFEETFSKSTTDKASFMATADALKTASEAAKAYKAQILAMNEALKMSTAGSKEELDIKEKINETNKELLEIQAHEKTALEALNVEREELIESEMKITKTGKKYKESLDDINNQYEKDIKKLTKDLADGKKSLEDYDKEVGNLQGTLKKKQILAEFQGMSKDLTSATNGAADAITDGIEMVAPELEPIMAIINQTIVAAFDQINELNKSLIDLQRSTGGMITAARLGYDATGNSAKGMMSLKTATLAANVSVEEYDKALKSLAGGGFGQTIGTVQDLTKSSDELQKYGIEASRAMKMYNADLGPAARNLFQNFGKGIGESTQILKESADKAKSLGLNVATMIKNFTDVTDLVGEVYFKTNDEMQKLALVATQLGVSVGTMAHGLTKMNGIIDLFSAQQKSAALGLNMYAKNLAKVYALQKSGQSGSAAKLEFSSLAKDLASQGLIGKGGQVSQHGIATLEGAGVSKDAIAGVQKLAMQAERTGIDIGQLGDTSKLTKMQQLKIAHDEAANIGLEEQFNQITGLVKQSFVDPLAKMFGPALQDLLGRLKLLAEMFNVLVSTIMDLLDAALAPATEIFHQLREIIMDILSPLKNLWVAEKAALTPMINAFRQVGVFVAKFIMMPFRIVGRIIGGVIDVFTKIITVISNKVTPIFDWFADLFKGRGDMLGDVLDGITVAFGYVADFVGGVLEVAFDVLGTVIGWVVSGLKLLWAGLTKAWHVIDKYMVTPIRKVLSPVFQTIVGAIQTVIDGFKGLWEGLTSFGKWLYKWFGGSDDETEDVLKPDWNTILGANGSLGAELATPGIPRMAGGGFVEKPTDTMAKAKIEAAAQTALPAPMSKTNVTINTKVDGVISNEQSVKKPV